MTPYSDPAQDLDDPGIAVTVRGAHATLLRSFTIDTQAGLADVRARAVDRHRQRWIVLFRKLKEWAGRWEISAAVLVAAMAASVVCALIMTNQAARPQRRPTAAVHVSNSSSQSGGLVYLSDAVAGYDTIMSSAGPEAKASPVRFEDRIYRYGIRFRQPSAALTVLVPPGYKRLTAVVGIPDTARDGPRGFAQCTLTVELDGRPLTPIRITSAHTQQMNLAIDPGARMTFVAVDACALGDPQLESGTAGGAAF